MERAMMVSPVSPINVSLPRAGDQPNKVKPAQSDAQALRHATGAEAVALHSLWNQMAMDCGDPD